MFARSHALCALSMFAMLSIVRADAAPAFDPSPYLHAQRLVDVGGRRMNLYCTGHGSPTVVLGTDGDDGTPAWRFVQPEIAKRTRVCSYDSAGLGFSDPVTTTLDASSAVTDLHELLAHANVAPPFVIVGYSLSGLYARLYADRYSREVAGMVLVAPNVPDQRKRLSAVAPALGRALAQAVPFDKRCTAAAEHGRMHPDTPEYSACMYTPPDPTLPKALVDLIHLQWSRPGTWRDYSSADSETSSASEVVREQRDYGNMPLIVLTTTKDITMLPIPKSQKAALARAWVSWHEDIAHLSRQGTAFVVPGSTQSIPIERPAVVVSAIDKVLDKVRYR